MGLCKKLFKLVLDLPALPLRQAGAGCWILDTRCV